MRYTQSQVRDLLAISVDAFRVWRQAIPALGQHKGHAPTFTPGEIVALAALSDLIHHFGIRVNTLNRSFNDMFLVCRGMSWQSLRSCAFTVDSDGFRLAGTDDLHHFLPQMPTIFVPCAPIIDRLQTELHSTDANHSQGQLTLRPSAVA